VLASGTGVLSYPPSLHSVHADHGAVSAALLDAHGNYLQYLNATPEQGGEDLSDWCSFRIAHLRDEASVSVHEEACVVGLSFRGGKGSCVIDDYVTRFKHNHFREIACFVKGRGAGSVIVAAAPAARWERLGPQLERAVAAYEIKPGR